MIDRFHIRKMPSGVWRALLIVLAQCALCQPNENTLAGIVDSTWKSVIAASEVQDWPKVHALTASSSCTEQCWQVKQGVEILQRILDQSEIQLPGGLRKGIEQGIDLASQHLRHADAQAQAQ